MNRGIDWRRLVSTAFGGNLGFEHSFEARAKLDLFYSAEGCEYLFALRAGLESFLGHHQT
jgi:hypothetical protein